MLLKNCTCELNLRSAMFKNFLDYLTNSFIFVALINNFIRNERIEFEF